MTDTRGGAGVETEVHESHYGNHVGYACGFSGPHCWTCNEPWPCRARRGIRPEPSYIEVRSSACHAGMDGECSWSECPQEADGRANYQSHCPLDFVPAIVQEPLS